MSVDLTKRYRLTNRDIAVLDLKRSWFKRAGAKDTILSARFSMSATR